MNGNELFVGYQYCNLFFQDQFPKHAAEYIDWILVDEQPAISVISEMELLC